MATINLGSIKFKWQGAYNGATAYTVDDVVSYNGSSYICTANSTGNLPTNTSYFEQMSSAGTDADLLSISGTAQGDIYYNSGGAIAKLAAGTSGQYLQTQGSGANPQWSTLSSDYVKILSANASGSADNITVDNIFDDTTYKSYKIIWTGTPAASNTKIYFQLLDNTGTRITASSYTSGYATHYINASTNSTNNYMNWNTGSVVLHADAVTNASANCPQVGEMDIFFPEANNAYCTFLWTCTADDGSGTSLWRNDGMGRYTVQTAVHRGIYLYANNGQNLDSTFNVVVYGLKK